MAGVETTGFVIKTLDEIQASIVARQKAAPEIGPNQDFSAHGALGQINGVVAQVAAELWELGEAVFQSQDPEAATDHALDVVSSLTGTRRRAATRSTVTASIDLDPGTTIPPLARVSVTGRPDIVFELDPDLYPDGFTHAGDDTVDLTFRCTVEGPIAVNAGTLEVIDTVTAGWNSVTNAADAVLGRVRDNDIVLRQRRVDGLAKRGGSTVRAIRADLLDSENNPALAGIEDAIVLENETDIYDGNTGLPPHSFEAVVDDGLTPAVADDVIAQVVFDSAPTGIPARGTESGVATDEDGNPHTTRFSRATSVSIWVEIEIEVDPDDFPADGVDQVKAAIVAKGNALKIGADVIALKIKSAPLIVPGLVDITDFDIGRSVLPTSEANVEMALRERARFDTSRVTVTVV